MKNFRLLPLLVVVVSIIPLSLFLWTTSSILKNSIHPVVANDPQTSLAQALSGLRGAYYQWNNKMYIDALRSSQREDLKKFLISSTTNLKKFKAIGTELVDSCKCPLVILTSKKGGVLFMSVNTPQPTPSPTTKKSRNKVPLLITLKDLPGLDQSLAGKTVSGYFSFQGILYDGSQVPVLSKDKTLGAVILGVPVDDNYLKFLRYGTTNDVAIYSQVQTWCSQPGLAPRIEYAKMMETMSAGGHPGPPTKVDWNHGSYLADGFPLYGVDMKPLAFLATFQPIKQVVTVEGMPQKTVLKAGFWILLAALLLALLILWQFMVPFNRLVEAIDQMKQGNFNTSLPVGRPDELGHMARSLQGMVEGIKEKDRISLILGKVVSPQLAKNILEAKDLFALKGERRQVTILYANLRGFNILSENMAPQALVEALNQYFSLINEVVFKYEGMLDKFIGDTAIAVWGAPFTHEDKELRAVKTALEIQEALKDFNIARIKKGHPPFTISVGIHTGMVVAGNLGSEKRSDYTIIGDPLHVAERLCAMATPGQTVASDETYEKVKGQVKSNPLNPIAVKGSMEPLKTYEIASLL